MTRVTGRGGVLLIASLLSSLGCSGSDNKSKGSKTPTLGQGENTQDAGAAEQPDTCPLTAKAQLPHPSASVEERTADFWIQHLAKRHDMDAPLLSEREIDVLNRAMQVERKGFHGPKDLLVPIEGATIQTQIVERIDWLKAKLDAGSYKLQAGKSLEEGALEPFELELRPEHRVALAPIQFYCSASTVGFFDKDAVDERIDLNTCSSAIPQELIEVLGEAPNDMLVVRSSTTWGYMEKNAPLSPPLEHAEVAGILEGPTALLRENRAADSIHPAIPANTRLPLTKSGKLLVATSSGLQPMDAGPDAITNTARPLSRRALLEDAFQYLDQPYGYGGKDGGIDCSRFMMSLFAGFGLDLPRHSSWQAKAGDFMVSVKGLEDAKKIDLIDEASNRGIVLLHLPGHIMLYLGKNAEGHPMVIHALGHYKEACDEGGETTFQVDQVQVSDLELGRGSSKTALIERIDRFAVFGDTPGQELESIALRRPALPPARPSSRECRKAATRRFLVSPRKPHKGAPLRVTLASSLDQGPAAMTLFGPRGKRQDLQTTPLGGPPYGITGRSEKVSSGKWMAVIGDGETIHACKTINIRSSAPTPGLRLKTPEPAPLAEGAEPPAPALDKDGNPLAPAPPVWSVRRHWSPTEEDFYSLFVERLFDYEMEGDQTWPNLHTLLRDEDHNILHGYYGLDEEELIKLVPDCADLPYTLRAYFAWKRGLPFGVHECRRAREGKAPRCSKEADNLLMRSALKKADPKDDVSSFVEFANKVVRRTVHSSSGRTAPDDDDTDFYPVPLSRKALRPGTLFTDPYGHLLIIADWIPQGASGYGALIGADAQPDGTIGRRRFWRGSFLFHPDTKSGGAGFKAFRPWVYDKESDVKELTVKPNDELKRAKPARYSREQYRGSTSDFYDKMQGIINPRPLDPRAQMVSLVDALEEQTLRRITSVNNGEDYMQKHPDPPMVMPEGSKIFLTSGPWEDFATPSRDWRLLIAIHTVADFPQAVKRSPRQYGVVPTEAEARAAQLQKELNEELATRRFTYKRSDGSDFELSLKDIVDRRVAFEMAYNPNDCMEIRWGAPEGSAEMSTCKRHAPAEQRQRMESHRPWFSKRKRPAS